MSHTHRYAAPYGGEIGYCHAVPQQLLKHKLGKHGGAYRADDHGKAAHTEKEHRPYYRGQCRHKHIGIYGGNGSAGCDERRTVPAEPGRGRAIRSRFARRTSLSAAPYAIGTAALTAEECAGTAGAAERSERLPDMPREFASQVRCGFITGIFFAFPASALTELRFSAEILSAGALFKEQDSM